VLAIFWVPLFFVTVSSMGQRKIADPRRLKLLKRLANEQVATLHRVAAFVLSGCSLIPDYQQPEAPVAAQYPQGPAYSPAQAPAQPPPNRAGSSFSMTRPCSS
jgi:hypothetical protein